jgi:hypothetical protein
MVRIHVKNARISVRTNTFTQQRLYIRLYQIVFIMMKKCKTSSIDALHPASKQSVQMVYQVVSLQEVHQFEQLLMESISFKMMVVVQENF